MLLHVGCVEADCIRASLNGQFAFRTCGRCCESHETAEIRYFIVEDIQC